MSQTPETAARRYLQASKIRGSFRTPRLRMFLQNAAAGGVALVERRFCDGIGAGKIC